jgi:hypothetical protein
MSEQPQPPLPHEDFVKDEVVPSAKPLLDKKLSKSPFQDYIDLDSDTSGLFGTLEIEAAKQTIRQIQS